MFLRSTLYSTIVEPHGSKLNCRRILFFWSFTKDIYFSMLFKHHILIKIFTLVIIFLSNAAYIGVVVCIQQLSEVETSSPLYITESIYVSVYDSQPISDYF